jgi:hypothetical protein|nr:MAG TPA: Baseplate component [Caudoviricetes sp.]
MEHVEHRIKLDLMKAGLQGQVIVKKADSDSRKINIFLSSAAGPYNMKDITSAILRAEKPDGKVMFNSCTVCEDRLEYIITTQTIAATGTVTCEITLMSSSGQVLVTPQFEIIVADIIYSDTEIESTNEYTALEEAIKKAAALKDGTTFTPSVSDEGVLSWSNSDGKENPAAVSIKGPKGNPGDKGDKGDPGKDGADGSTGAAGADGVTPTIGENGNWYLGETDTGKPSRGEKGDTGASGEPGKDGTNGSPGADGLTPTIGENGNWYFDNVDTGKPSRGLQGETGVGIATCNLFYQYGNSNVTPPTGSWTTVIPPSATGEYLWTRIQFTYTEGKSPTFITLVTKQGKDGSDASVTAANIETALGYTPQAVSSKIATGSNITLADNTEYRLTDVTTLNLSYPEGAFESWMRLTFAESGNITVTLPADTKYIGTAPDFKNGETWELSFKDKVLAAQKVGEGT